MSVDVVPERLEFLLLLLEISLDEADGSHSCQNGLSLFQPRDELVKGAGELLAVLHGSVQPLLAVLSSLLDLLPLLVDVLNDLLLLLSISLG